MDLIKWGLGVAQDHRQSRWVCPLLLVADVAFCGLIIWKVPYTEIDWRAYMEQVSQYVAGERDYIKIKGGTGPLVYPAAHVFIYKILYDITDRGKDIKLAQYIFGVLYLLTLAVVMGCYRNAKVPPYVYPMLILSKRLHSIFMLRLFNDCFAVFFLFCSVSLHQHGLWSLGSILFSLGLGVKMSLLLALPAIAVILYLALGTGAALRQAGLMLQTQALLATPFIRANFQSYFSRAFEFSRVFLFKWTVNWRFVGENIFLSKSFSAGLLAAHAALLVLFLSTRWFEPSGRSLTHNIRAVFSPATEHEQAQIRSRVTARYILTTVLTAIAIGMLCARSLHYQFYALIAWASPFLLWRAGLHPVLQYLIWGAQEYAWNVYPSTSLSSMIVVAALSTQVVAVWIGTGARPETQDESSKAHSE